MDKVYLSTREQSSTITLPKTVPPLHTVPEHRAMMKHAEHDTEESDAVRGADRQWECNVAWQDDGGDRESICESFRLLQIDTGCDSPKDLPVGSEKWYSRNVLRKQRHWEKIVTAKKKKRKQEKERRKAKHAEDKGAAHQHSKRILKEIAKERLLAAKEAAPWLCVDLSLTSHMTKKEISRLAAQIRRLYGSNKKAGKPFWICLTGFVAGSPISEECFRMNDGFSNYLMDTTPESYLDLFPSETIIYLTPDSENALQDIDPHRVYVLGGLVDESIQKKLTLQKAQEHSLQTARLPIAEYMVRNTNVKNYHSETLAINQVFDALSTYYETQSWPEALKAGVPPGKGYVLQETAI
ncbi:tRNA methyltransferase 10 homolog B isoform X4 [Dermochelys coriacea]|uniref:tRNA methyltransferase 10 homolog B isoform X4 n=2 Tax=Dermochelys coriacea TaxID=27794 RepID=UPI0018E82367|nr:tRNA methyltransferase 10 homolog B isoform X4 [Dermochelys coriacea]